jgi:hypothetical protein
MLKHGSQWIARDGQLDDGSMFDGMVPVKNNNKRAQFDVLFLRTFYL